MEFIDTHAHLYLSHFEDDLDKVVDRAKTAGISNVYLPNIDSGSIDSLHALEDRFPDFFYPLMGLHPCSVKENYRSELDIVTQWVNERNYKGIGEIGIDLYWDKSYYEEQVIAFKYQIELAKAKNWPIIIHSRESLDLTIDIVSELQDGTLSGVFHCFTGNVEQAKTIQDIGFYMGIGGVLTFKNGGLDKIVDQISLQNLVLETDSPYLSPVPYRGKRNESAYVLDIATRLASLLEMDLEEIARITSDNAKTLFSAITPK